MPKKNALIPFLPVEKSSSKLLYLTGLFVCCVMVANIVATKIASFGFTYATVAIIFYPLTFVIADTVSEVWGKRVAQRMVWTGLAANIVMTGMFAIAVYTPGAPFYQDQSMFQSVLLSVPRIVLASVVAFSVSQNLDIFMFLGLRQKTEGRHLWLRNNASTMASQLIDTIIFSFIAFFGTMSVSEIWTIIGTEYSLKLIMSILFTPVVYLLVAWARSNTKEAAQHERKSA